MAKEKKVGTGKTSTSKKLSTKEEKPKAGKAAGNKSSGGSKKASSTTRGKKRSGDSGVLPTEEPQMAGNNKSKPTRTSKKKVAESAVPEIKESLSEIIPRAYNTNKFKEWVENMEEVTCKQIRVTVKSDAGKHCHAFQIKLYLRDLAEKHNVGFTNFQLFDDHFEFTLIQPVEMAAKELI